MFSKQKFFAAASIFTSVTMVIASEKPSIITQGSMYVITRTRGSVSPFSVMRRIEDYKRDMANNKIAVKNSSNISRSNSNTNTITVPEVYRFVRGI